MPGYANVHVQCKSNGVLIFRLVRCFWREPTFHLSLPLTMNSCQYFLTRSCWKKWRHLCDKIYVHLPSLRLRLVAHGIGSRFSLCKQRMKNWLPLHALRTLFQVRAQTFDLGRYSYIYVYVCFLLLLIEYIANAKNERKGALGGTSHDSRRCTP